MPDALVGHCWPAVFSVIGSAVTEDGFPVVEGLLSLVHLDHAAHLLAPMPKTPAELRVTATASAATDTEYGRVVPVKVTITDAAGTSCSPPWRSGSLSVAAPVGPSSPSRCAPAVRSPTTPPTLRVAAAGTSTSPRRPT